MKNPANDPKPLVLLDVDGVINDVGALGGTPRPWRTDIVVSHGFRLHIPEYMPQLISRLAECTELHWCTTWRDRANGDIAAHLGIERLPVITDGSTERAVRWKAPAARPAVENALDSGRDVVWIEDFYGNPPLSELPHSVTYVDTTILHPRGVLTPADLPDRIRRYLPSVAGPTHRPTSTTRGETPWG